MINANELRLFNWVEYKMEDGSWMPLQIIKLSIDELHRQHIRPIPLTQQILESCGFKMNGNGYFIKQPWAIKGCEDGWPGFRFCEFYQGQYAIITSLHQLQNLYFALTGTELEYNPK